MQPSPLRILAFQEGQSNLGAILSHAFPEARIDLVDHHPHALETALAHDPDVVLLEVGFPAADGYALCRALKDDARLREVPVILLSTPTADQDRRAKGLEAGAEALLSQPVDEIELIAQVRAMARLRAAIKWQNQEKEHLAELVAERTCDLRNELAARHQAEQKLVESRQVLLHLVQELKSEVEARQESRAILQSFYDSSPLMMGVAELDGERLLAVSANAATARFFQLPAQEQPNRTAAEMGASPEATRLWLAQCRNCQHEGIPVRFEYQHAAAQGARWLSATVSYLGQSAQGLPRFSFVVDDTTEEKRAEGEREKLRAQLTQAQKMEAIGQLAGGVAHDFNNILAAILMQLGLLRDEPNLAPGTSEALKELETSAMRAASLARQLLMFSRRSVLDVKVLDVNELVENLLKMLRRVIGEHIELRFECGAGLPPVEADAGMLEQVLMNLAVNARDAMPKGGRITIATAAWRIDPDQAHVNPNRRPGEFVCLSVRDTGCGMNEATLKHLFEPFFTTKEVGKGTGLGLATVHGIVAQHEGWLEVESQVGAGSVFRVLLPVGKRALEVRTEADAVPLTSFRGTETILLVEDEAAVRRHVSRFFRLLGYQVLEAADGLEATTLWMQDRERINLLFTDMVMPGGVSGLELAERFQADKPSLRVIISSGYNNEMTQPIVRPGMKFLPKPYEVSRLGATLRACLEHKTSPGPDAPRHA